MANTFNGNRFVIDTAAATLLNVSLSHLPLPLKILGIRWVGGTTNAHQAIIQDTASIVLWEELQATTSLNESKESRIPIVFSTDFKVPTLDSGILYIYLDV